jgi:hypothetical protein
MRRARSPHKRSDMRAKKTPDLALMSFVKCIGQATSSPCALALKDVEGMIVQGWGRSLKTSVIKL